jgi:hypothetical protein
VAVTAAKVCMVVSMTVSTKPCAWSSTWATRQCWKALLRTIDPSRKNEILKEWAKHFRNADWRKTLTHFLDKVET